MSLEPSKPATEQLRPLLELLILRTSTVTLIAVGLLTTALILLFVRGSDAVELSAFEIALRAAPVAIAAVVFIIVATVLAVRPLVREVENLSRAVRILNPDDVVASLQKASDVIEKTTRSSRETAILADILADSFKKLRDVGARRSRFIAEASHELRTPLTALRGEIEIALRRERPAEIYRESLQVALESTEKLQALTNHLLEVSKAEHIDKQLVPTDLRDAIREAIRIRKPLFETRGIEIIWNEPAQHRTAWADHLLAVRAIANLLDNVDAHARATKVAVHTRIEGDHVFVSVNDDGIGVDGEAIDDLFEPFGRSIDSPGHGLGLTLVRSLMRTQGGDVQWTGAGLDGKGARFELRFRAAKGPVA